jgi:hypothetical protein
MRPVSKVVCKIGAILYITNSVSVNNQISKKVAVFKYLGTTLTNQNGYHDEIKSRLNSGNAYYRSVQNLLFSRLV